MEDISRKRASSGDDSYGHEDRVKRQRTATLESGSTPAESISLHHTAAEGTLEFDVIKQPTAADLGRDGLQRSIALALQHVGFETANQDALESFTEATETYISGFIGQLTRTANAARRNNPIPTDFEALLRTYSIPISSLEPHLDNPVPKRKLKPSYYDPIIEDVAPLQKPRPYLGEELDGRQEKEARPWIPKSFPAFPSKHTYRWNEAPEAARGPEKKRAEASADARKGEMALRRIDRAAKISRQKELKELASRDPLSQKRHKAWEGLMKDLLPDRGAANGAMDIADHSTVVNAGAKYGRKELPRTSRRIPTEASYGQT
ncbi:hypothetical protein F4780DRAFT_781199 [Xylariomycetidae sp. FL0641]|nr:hypothetical protein F4780DRAFT_781199 [Xylariomycetidae sp. FL0641]